VEPKIPGVGQRYCEPCREIVRSDAAERYRLTQRAREESDRRTAGAPRNVNRDAPEGTKWCPGCRRYLSFKNFSQGGKRGIASKCRPCAGDASWANNIKKFNITVEQYFALLDSQGGVCHICQRVPRKRRLAVDHDHSCCKAGGSCGSCIRGLLCSTCNHRILGGAQDSVEILRRAVEYMENNPAKAILGRNEDHGKIHSTDSGS
jgi:hypothetical protein